MCPSDIRTLLMNLPSALPFSRLGVGVGVLLLATESLTGFGFRVARAPLPASGLEGMLLFRPSPLGGFGKEFMLTAFRTVFEDAAASWPAFGIGGMLLLEEAGDAVEGARRPLRGAAGDFGLGMEAMLFRLFGTESVGREVSDGPIEGRGRGRAVAMLPSAVRYKKRGGYKNYARRSRLNGLCVVRCALKGFSRPCTADALGQMSSGRGAVALSAALDRWTSCRMETEQPGRRGEQITQYHRRKQRYLAQ